MVLPSFPPGEVRISYGDINLSATGGKPPYSWSISAGALPDGLGLSAGGVINGTPAAAGGFSFTVLVTDSAKSAAGASGAIDIANYLSGNGTCTTGCAVEAGCLTVCGSYAKPVGGVAPFKFSLASGALPPSTTLGFPALGGQFTSASTYTFTVSVTDALGAKTAVTATFNVFSHIFMKVGTLPGGYVKVAYSASIPYGGGSGIPKVAVVKGALPPGLTAVVNPKLGTVVISGTPTAQGKYAFYLRLTDTSPCGPGYNCFVTSPVLSITILLG